MTEKNNTLNYLVDLIKNNCPSVKSVSRQFKLINQFRKPELPAVIIIDGPLTRTDFGQRLLFTFEVIIRIVDYNEDHISESINNVADEILNTLDNDPYLGGNSIKPIRLLRIETDEGWLSPFGVSDIRIETYFASCRRI